MSIFGIGFRIVLAALAVVIERVGALFRQNPLLRSFFASEAPAPREDDL